MSGQRRRRGLPTFAWLLLILAIGAGLRLAYLQELRHAPDFAEPLADAAFHDYWARGLATGDWTPPGNEPDPRIAHAPYLRPPGYPYFLGGVYSWFGADPVVPRVVQMFVGLLNVLLAWWVSRRLLGRAGGLLVAAFSAIAWTSIYFEGELQAPTLQITGMWLTLLALLTARDRAAPWLALAAGLALGATGLVRANVLALAPLAALWLAVVTWRAGRGRALLGAAAVILGTVVAVAPATWRNHQVADAFVPVSVNGAVNLYIGNNEEADGTSAKIPRLRKMTGRGSWNWFRYGDVVRGLGRDVGRDLTYVEASREFTNRARAWMEANPGAAAKLALRRVALFWGPSEISNNKAIRFEKQNSRVLRHFPAFPAVFALCLLGVGQLALAGRRRGYASPALADVDRAGLWLVGIVVLATSLTYAPFLAAARFRAPLVPLLFVFGAYALLRLAAYVRCREYGAAAGAVVAAAVLFAVVRLGGQENEVDRAWWHTDRGIALRRQDRTDDAIREFDAALAVNPGFIDAHHHLGDLLLEQGDRYSALDHYNNVLQHRPGRTDLMMKSAVVLIDLRRFEEAERLLSTCIQVVPDSPDPFFERGRVLIELGRLPEAEEMLDRSLVLAPDHVPATVNRGIARAKQGRTDAAIADFVRATEINPLYAEAFFHLGEVFVQAGRRGDAVLAYQQAAAVSQRYVEPRVHLGNLLNEDGRWEEAIEAYEGALDIDPAHVVARYNLAGSLGNAGRLEEAEAHLQQNLETNPAHELSRQRLAQVRSMLGR